MIYQGPHSSQLKKMHFGQRYIRRFRNNCEIVEEPNSSSKNCVRVKFLSLITCFDEDMNQSESFVGIFCPCYDCQSNIDITFLNYSGNV